MRPAASGILLALPALAGAGCRKNGAPVVLVKVDAAIAVSGVTRLRATFSNQGTADTGLFPAMDATALLSFPTAFTVTLPHGRSGDLDVALDGLDAGGAAVAQGAGQTEIRPGAVAEMSIIMAPGAATCGNGRPDPAEECDDGNRASGDGCDYLCRREAAPGDGAGGADGGPVEAGPERPEAGSDVPALASWTNRTPSPLPPAWPSARREAGLAYDGARGRVVMFGGYDGSFLADIWEWDGVSWLDRTPVDAKPSGRRGHGLVFDAGRGRIVLFGGYNGDSPMKDVWEWDGATGRWTDRTGSATAPVARFGLAITFDAGRGRAVAYGGIQSLTGCCLSDLWEWDGAAGTWEDRTPAMPPASWPGQKQRAGMTYDGERKRVILFGGASASTPSSDVWEWDGAAGTWAYRTPSPLPASWPAARQQAPLVWDPRQKAAVVFGGISGTTILQDTWLWNGAAGTFTVWTMPDPPPPARAASGLTFDSARGRMVLFGGYSGTADLRDLWEH